MRLQIGEWPVLQLGPTAIAKPEDVPEALGRLLSEDSVRDASRSRWGTATTEHPRYGKVNGQLAAWSPTDGEARIECRSRLTQGDEASELRWQERAEAKADSWLSSILGNPAAKAEAFLKRVTDLVRTSTGLEMELSPDPEAGQQWLTLYPLRARLRGSLQVALGLTVGVAGVQIDQNGIHLPDEYEVAYRTTFPFAHCALSDPTVRVGLKHRSLAIGCKITPPTLPIPGLARGAMPTAEQVRQAYGLPSFLWGLRLDNPWLHLAYLEGELSGSWVEQRLGGTARVRLLNAQDVAHASFEMDFRRGEFAAFLNAEVPLRAARLSIRLDGEARASRREWYLRGEAQLWQLAQLDATFRYLAARSPGEVFLTANARMPVLGYVGLRGRSDLSFQRYRLAAEGRIRLPWRTGTELEYLVEVSDQRTVMDFRWNHDGVPVSCRVEGVSPDAFDESELRSKIEAGGGEPPPALTEAERDYVKALPSEELARPETPPEEKPSEEIRTSWYPPDPVAEKKDKKGGQGKTAPVECHNPAGSRYHFSYNGTAGQIQGEASLPIAKAGFRDPKECQFLAWIDPDPRSTTLERFLFVYTLVFDWSDKKVLLIRWKTQDDGEVEDLTPQFAPIGSLFAEAPPQEKKHAEVRRAIAAGFVALLHDGHKLHAPRKLAEGYLLEYTPQGLEDRLNADFAWVRGTSVYRVRLLEPYVPRAERTETFFQRLTNLEPRKPVLLVASQGEGRRLATLERITSGTWLLHPAGGEEGVSIKDVPGTAPDHAELAHRCALATWKGELPDKGIEGYFGPGGAMFWSEAGTWLLPGEATLPGSKPQAHFVPRQKFVNWASESERFLPAALRSAAARERVTPEQLALIVLSDWRNLRRHQPEWGTAPMGLLLGLSNDKEANRGR